MPTRFIWVIWATLWIALWSLGLFQLTGTALPSGPSLAEPVWLAGAIAALGGLAAMGGCLRAASGHAEGPRRIWLCFAIGCGLWALFQGLWTYESPASNAPGTGQWIAIGWLGASFAQVAALFLLTARAAEPYLFVRRLCQLGILLVCGYAVVAFPLHEAIARPDLGRRDVAVLIGCMILEPAGAIFALTGLIARGNPARSLAAALLIGGSLLRGAAFVAQGLDALDGGGGHPAAMPLWMAGFAFTFFAAIRATREPRDTDPQETAAPGHEAMRARAVEIAVPILAVIAVVVSRLLTREPIDTEEAALIIVPTLFGIVVMFSVGEWCDRADQARLRRNAETISDTLTAILHIVPDAVIGVDQRGTIRLVNRSGELMFGYQPGELLGQPMEILIPPAQRKHHAELVSNFRQQKIALRMGDERAPIRVLRRDGSQFSAEAWLQRLARESETWFIISLRDITDQMTHARQLESARRNAEVANRAKSEFLANMSHELRTPLNAIIGFSEVIEGQILGENITRDRDYAREIRRAGLHLLEIINDILDLSKIEAGRVELHEAPVDMPYLFDACLRLVKERAERGRVIVAAEVEAGLPKLLADEVKLKQILINLLSNGIKFTPIGGHVAMRAELRADGRLALSVRDTGIGMRKEDIPKALAVFGQVDSGIARLHEGTGLGLPLTRKLAELHQAEFQIESTPGAGTLVTILFPAQRLCLPAEPAPQPEMRGQATG